MASNLRKYNSYIPSKGKTTPNIKPRMGMFLFIFKRVGCEDTNCLYEFTYPRPETITFAVVLND